MDSTVDGSPRRLARIAGALYLINILGGAFAITVVPAMVVVQDDLAATAHNLQTHELLYRSGLAAHLVVTTTNVFLAVLFYFKLPTDALALLPREPAKLPPVEPVEPVPATTVAPERTPPKPPVQTATVDGMAP